MSTTHPPYRSAPTFQSPQQPSPQQSTVPDSDSSKTAMQDFRQLFDMFDINRNGTIEFDEFNHIIRMLGDQCPQGETLNRMLRIACEIPSTRSIPTYLTFDQFMRFFAIYKQDASTEVTHHDIFNLLDLDKGGSVSPAELATVLNRFGMRVSHDEANAMADFATPLPGANHIGLADISAVAERVRRLRHTSMPIADTSDTSDTSEDDTMTRV